VALAAFVACDRMISPMSSPSAVETTGDTIWIAASVAIGILIGARSSASSWIPGLLRRTTAFGPAQAAVRSDRHEVRGAERRRLLELVRNDPNIVATLANVDHGLRPHWGRLRATRRAVSGSNTMVAVPGDGITLRIVVANDKAASVIGETRDALFTASDGVVHRHALPQPAARLR
jgi:hypothetical protein